MDVSLGRLDRLDNLCGHLLTPLTEGVQVSAPAPPTDALRKITGGIVLEEYANTHYSSPVSLIVATELSGRFLLTLWRSLSQTTFHRHITIFHPKASCPHGRVLIHRR